MSALTQDTFCASWLDETPVAAWGWLRGDGEWSDEWRDAGVAIDPAKARMVRGLIDACGVWWESYEKTIPIDAWIERHGPLDA